MRTTIQVVLLFLLGAILGPACDWFHVASHTSGYKYSVVCGMAWWVPLLFGVATVAVAVSHVFTDKYLKRAPRDRAWSSVFFGIFDFAAIYFISGFFAAPHVIKFFILGSIATAIWFVFDRTWQGLLMAVTTAIAGCAVEATLCWSGLFFYTKPDFLGIPAWLPFLYIAASVSVGNLGRKLLAT